MPPAHPQLIACFLQIRLLCCLEHAHVAISVLLKRQRVLDQVGAKCLLQPGGDAGRCAEGGMVGRRVRSDRRIAICVASTCAVSSDSTAAATASAAASSCGMMGGMPEELLSLLPEYVFNMEEEQLAMLVQFLGDEKYACLLEDPTSQEFQDLVNQIAPGIAEINPDEDEAIGNNAYSTSNMYYAQDDPNQYYQQQSLYSPPLQSTQQSYYGQDYHQQHRQQFNQYYDQQYYATGSQQPPVSSYGYDPHTHQQQNSYNQQAYPPQHAHPPQGRGQYPYQHHHSHQQQQGYGTQGYGSYHGGGYGY